jgi:uncharacterized protein (DUF952 family)
VKILSNASEEEWESERGSGAYGEAQIARCGFIHCSTPEQFELIKDRFKGAEASTIMLSIETDKVKSPIKWEAGKLGVAFPHIYGLLNLDAVEKVERLSERAKVGKLAGKPKTIGKSKD